MEKFIGLFEQLDKQCRYYCRHLGHLKGLLDNDDWMRVVDGSMSGRVLWMGNSEITNALILFNTRMFDKGPDTISIQKLAAKLPTEQEIERWQRDRMKRIGFEYDLDAYYTARAEFVTARRGLKRNGTQAKLRSLRDYTLAHNIVPETEPERATLNDLIELTEAVNELVDLAGYIVQSTRGVYRDFAESAEKETRMLYAALPVLTKVERD